MITVIGTVTDDVLYSDIVASSPVTMAGGTKSVENEFEVLVKPVMEYLHREWNPYARIIIDGVRAELVEESISAYRCVNLK